jgi:hypothetical protein
VTQVPVRLLPWWWVPAAPTPVDLEVVGTASLCQTRGEGSQCPDGKGGGGWGRGTGSFSTHAVPPVTD